MTEVATPAAKTATVYETVKMKDGREVNFAGKRQIDKTPLIDEEKGRAGVRFDFRNGESLTLYNDELPAATQLQALAHGLAQKLGDEAAGEKDIDDIVVAIDDMAKRLKDGDWRVTREAGDSFAGANVVIKALAEVTGKSVDDIKTFLQGKLDESKAAAANTGAKPLTRAELYAAFRKPGTKTAAVISRLEAEKVQKAARVDANDLLTEIA